MLIHTRVNPALDLWKFRTLQPAVVSPFIGLFWLGPSGLVCVFQTPLLKSGPPEMLSSLCEYPLGASLTACNASSVCVRSHVNPSDEAVAHSVDTRSRNNAPSPSLLCYSVTKPFTMGVCVCFVCGCLHTHKQAFVWQLLASDR